MNLRIALWPRRSGKSRLIDTVRQYNELVTDPSKRVRIIGAGPESVTGEIGTFKGVNIYLDEAASIAPTTFNLCSAPRSPQQKGPPARGKKGKIKRW